MTLASGTPVPCLVPELMPRFLAGIEKKRPLVNDCDFSFEKADISFTFTVDGEASETPSAAHILAPRVEWGAGIPRIARERLVHQVSSKCIGPAEELGAPLYHGKFGEFGTAVGVVINTSLIEDRDVESAWFVVSCLGPKLIEGMCMILVGLEGLSLIDGNDARDLMIEAFDRNSIQQPANILWPG